MPLISADKYFDFVSTLFLAFGIVMEFPVVLILLSKVGIVTSARLKSTRRYAALAMVVFGHRARQGQQVSGIDREDHAQVRIVDDALGGGVSPVH